MTMTSQILILIAVILSALVSGFVSGISNAPASGLIISIISVFIVAVLPIYASRAITNIIGVQAIASLLIIFLITLLPTYLLSNYLRNHCDPRLGEMGFGAKHCKDSYAATATATRPPSKLAEIRCSFMGEGLKGCPQYKNN